MKKDAPEQEMHVNWQVIEKKMLLWDVQQKNQKEAISKLEQLAQSSEPVDPEKLSEILSLLKSDAA